MLWTRLCLLLLVDSCDLAHRTAASCTDCCIRRRIKRHQWRHSGSINVVVAWRPHGLRGRLTKMLVLAAACVCLQITHLWEVFEDAEAALVAEEHDESIEYQR